MRKKRRSSRKNISKTLVDHGTDELKQHGIFETIESSQAGVKILKNKTHDPIAFYFRKKLITPLQFQAAEIFAEDYRKAQLTDYFASAKINHIPGGQLVEQSEIIEDAKKRVRKALLYIGKPLSSITVHVCGNFNTAGSWGSVFTRRRGDREAMVALRLALDALVHFYKL
tara:strand:+ start:977 stop:1486 length:510 start_codon:yes stop_codon:yes gene_type:complete